MTRLKQDVGNGLEISYLDEGQGAPLLFLHGFTGTATADHGMLMDEYRDTHRIIAPDLRGYGASRPPNRDFPPDFYQRDADDMAAFLERLQCGPVVVLGFSDGAEVALLLAATRPDLVRGVVAWGVCGVISPEELASVERWLPVSGWGPERHMWMTQIIERHGPEQFEPMINGWVNAARAIRARGGDISYNVAGQIECPVLLMNGDREVGNTPQDTRRLAERIPNCRLEFVPDCGHAIQSDQPHILVTRIHKFLERIAD